MKKNEKKKITKKNMKQEIDIEKISINIQPVHFGQGIVTTFISKKIDDVQPILLSYAESINLSISFLVFSSNGQRLSHGSPAQHGMEDGHVLKAYLNFCQDFPPLLQDESTWDLELKCCDGEVVKSNKAIFSSRGREILMLCNRSGIIDLSEYNIMAVDVLVKYMYWKIVDDDLIDIFSKNPSVFLQVQKLAVKFKLLSLEKTCSNVFSELFHFVAPEIEMREHEFNDKQSLESGEIEDYESDQEVIEVEEIQTSKEFLPRIVQTPPQELEKDLNNNHGAEALHIANETLSDLPKSKEEKDRKETSENTLDQNIRKTKFCARAICDNRGRHRCARCKSVSFCSEKCLHEDWSHHEMFCNYVFEANNSIQENDIGEVD